MIDFIISESYLIIVIVMLILFSILIKGNYRQEPFTNLQITNDGTLIVNRIYSIKCKRCKEFIYDSDICYDNITKYPYHKKCLDVYDKNTEKQYQT